MKLAPAATRSFQKMIFSWWESNRRDLPWRHTRDPYRILISEVMLQQTQVSRVAPKYHEFLARFPDVHALADAPAAEVLKIWKGMGYNRRALYLKRTAESVVADYHGKFPDTEQELTKLPGLGTYTARAIMVFAFEKNVAMVDTNIRQILVHFFFHGRPQKEKLIQELADTLVPQNKSWQWHQALMDYGALSLPRGVVKQETAKKAAIPFKDSDRYIRGKIIDCLRDGKVNEHVLVIELMKKYGRTKAVYSTVFSKLIKDGLVVRSRSVLALPG